MNTFNQTAMKMQNPAPFSVAAESNTAKWQLAQSWLKSNHVLVWCIAGPYYRYMSGEAHDLESEALLTAYQVLTLLHRRGKSLELMTSYYRVAFRTRCIELATGVKVTDCDINQIPSCPAETHLWKQDELNPETIQNALQVLTKRQRQISEWILAQPTPINTATAGKQFGIQARAVRSIITNAIRRIEDYGHTTVQQAISAAA